MGRANCPLFAEQILLVAEFLSARLPAFLRDSLLQQWGIPPEHRSSSTVSLSCFRSDPFIHFKSICRMLLFLNTSPPFLFLSVFDSAKGAP